MGGGRGIAADDVHHAGHADFAGGHGLTHAGEVGIEAAIEADLQLHAGGFHGGEGAVDLIEIVGNGLFAEDVLAGLGGFDDQIGVGVGGRADQHRLDLRVGDDFGGRYGHLGNIAAGSQRLRGLAIDVGDGDDLGLRQAEGQCFRVDLANAAGANDSDVQILYAQSFLL